MKMSKSIGNNLAQRNFGNGQHIQSQDDFIQQLQWQAQQNQE